MRRRCFGSYVAFPGIAAAAAAISGCAVKVRLSQPAAVSPTYVPDDLVPRIDVAAAFAQVRDGRAILIDVRGAESWSARHAVGAISLPLDDIESAPSRALAFVPDGQRPILYCT